MTNFATPEPPPRTPIPQSVVDKILLACRRRCCLCYFLLNDHSEKEGQMAHIDRDHSNSVEHNIAFLCLIHHNLYDTRYSQSKRITPSEIMTYKQALTVALGTARTFELVIEGVLSEASNSQIGETIQKLEERFPGSHITLKYKTSGSIILGLELVSVQSLDDERNAAFGYEAIRQAFDSGNLSQQLGVNVIDLRPMPPLDIESLLRQADRSIEKKRFEDAIETINRVIMEFPFVGKAWALKSTALSEMYFQCYDSPDAEEMLLHAKACSDMAVHLAPTDAGFAASHAAILYEQGDRAGALIWCSRSVKLDRKNGLAWYNLGVVQYNSGDFNGAISSFRKSAALGYKRANIALANVVQRREISGGL